MERIVWKSDQDRIKREQAAEIARVAAEKALKAKRREDKKKKELAR
jgi:hypothetical protein